MTAANTAKELRAKETTELNEMLVSLHREQFNLKMQKATGQLSKPDQVAKNRKAIARINTVLSEKSSKS